MRPSNRIAVATAIAIGIAVPAEGLRQVAYRDPPGILTVCYGETRDIDPDKIYSTEECKAMLNESMREAVATVERCAPGLPVHTLAAFADAVYNLGPRIVCDTATSTAARLLKAGRIGEACMQLPRWNKAQIMGQMVVLPGLTKRRNAEMILCMKGLA